MLIYLCIYIHTFLNCIFSSPVLLWLPWIKGWLLPQPHVPQIDPPPPLCHHRCLNSTLDHVICWNPSEDSLAGHIRHVEIWPCFSPFSLLLPWFHGHMELCTISPNLDVLFVFLSSLEYSSPPPLFPGCFLLKLSISIVHYFFTDASLPHPHVVHRLLWFLPHNSDPLDCHGSFLHPQLGSNSVRPICYTFFVCQHYLG